MKFIIFISILSGYVASVYADTECAAAYGYEFYSDVQVWYKFYKTPMVWSDARLHCLSENATLAMPKDQKEMDALKKIFSYHPQSSLPGIEWHQYITLGFHYMFSKGEFLTDKGHSLDYFYKNFDDGQPNYGKNESCGGMSRNGRLHDLNCGVLHAFICQKENIPYMDRLWSHMGVNNDPAYIEDPKTLIRYKLHTDLRTWDVARSICHAEGGHLAIVNSKEEENFLMNMKNNPKNKISYSVYNHIAYIGVHDFFGEGQWNTVLGKNINNLEYVRWGLGDPNGGRAEQCGMIRNSGDIGDVPCSVSAMFFCELPVNVYNDPNNQNSHLK